MTSRLALALAVSCLVAPPAFAQRGAAGGSSGTASAGGASGGSSGTAVARGGSESSGSGSYGGPGGSSSSGSGRSGAVGGAWSRGAASRAAARSTAAPSPSGASANGAATRQAYARGGSAAAAAAAVPRYSRPNPGAPVQGQAVPRGSVPMTGGVNSAYVYGYNGYPYGAYGYGYPGYGYGYGYLYGDSLFGPMGYAGDFGLYGFGFGDYGMYDPAVGDIGVGYDPYASAGTFVPTGSSSSSSSADSNKPGALRFSVKPMKASVYVDGQLVGQAKQYDSVFRKLHLAAGAHEVQLKADGYQPVTFHVRIEPGKTEVYKGEMDKTSR